MTEFTCWDLSLQKGKFGEEIVRDRLQKQGRIAYSPPQGIAHPFDLLIYNPDDGRISLGEVKSNPRRKYYEDNGIRKKSYKKYHEIRSRIGFPLTVFWVDEVLGAIYGGDLSRLMMPHRSKDRDYPIQSAAGDIYFALDWMHQFWELTSTEIATLREYSAKIEELKRDDSAAAVD